MLNACSFAGWELGNLSAPSAAFSSSPCPIAPTPLLRRSCSEHPISRSLPCRSVADPTGSAFGARLKSHRGSLEPDNSACLLLFCRILIGPTNHTIPKPPRSLWLFLHACFVPRPCRLPHFPAVVTVPVPDPTSLLLSPSLSPTPSISPSPSVQPEGCDVHAAHLTSAKWHGSWFLSLVLPLSPL